MTRIGYHASHEQFRPSTLATWVQNAEDAGFTAAMCSDHLVPWNEAQGESGFAWSWLGAAMQATSLPFGVVNAPGQRYHPVIIAQAAATLAEMFPDRFWISLGSGEAINEHVTGEPWPPKAERNARLKECVDVMRALWAGEWVNHDGLVTVQNGKLYSLPAEPPKIMIAAISPATAEWAGSWADGLMTVAQPVETLQSVIDAFRRGGGEGKPMYLQVKLSYATTEERALQGAYDQWSTNILSSRLLSDLPLPRHYIDVAKFVRPEDLYSGVRISADPKQHLEWLREYGELGFEHLYLHNVNREQEAFIDVFGQHVLPQLG